MQRDGSRDTSYAPVVKLTTIRLLLATATEHGWHHDVVDI
jgi:hypothetical protein